MQQGNIINSKFIILKKSEISQRMKTQKLSYYCLFPYKKYRYFRIIVQHFSLKFLILRILFYPHIFIFRIILQFTRNRFIFHLPPVNYFQHYFTTLIRFLFHPFGFYLPLIYLFSELFYNLQGTDLFSTCHPLFIFSTLFYNAHQINFLSIRILFTTHIFIFRIILQFTRNRFIFHLPPAIYFSTLFYNAHQISFPSIWILFYHSYIYFPHYFTIYTEQIYFPPATSYLFFNIILQRSSDFFSIHLNFFPQN